MAGGVANRRGIVGAVNTDALFVERDPHHADRISRARSEEVKIAAALSVLEHFLSQRNVGILVIRRTFHSPIGEAVCAEPTVTG